MSDKGEVVTEEKPVTEQAGDVPETVIPENAVAPAPEPEPAPEETKAAAEPEPKPATKRPWFQTRIDELTKARREAERLAAAKEAELQLLKTKPASDGPATPATNNLTQAEWDRQVKEAAAQIVQQQAIQSKSKAWLDAGVKEYGREEFDAKCETLAALGGGDKPEFMALILDPDVIPDGHKIVAQLADKPEEAQRILSLPPVQMAAALTRFAMTAPAEKKTVSNAPKPITPIGGTAKASAPSESDDIKTWMAKRRADVAARQGR